MLRSYSMQYAEYYLSKNSPSKSQHRLYESAPPIPHLSVLTHHWATFAGDERQHVGELELGV